MKSLVLIVGLFAAFVGFTKDDVDMNKFNKAMMQNIDSVLKDNPEVYETKPIKHGRGPASVAPSEVIDTTEKLDEIDEQADGRKGW